MKNTKPIYILFFLITLSALDSVAQSPIYLYLKNGVIETFYPELTDSMTVSNIDENGNEYDEPIVQRIYSNDSVYVYNLIDIDSIGLYVPPTILKPGVIDINKELINYVIGSEDLTLTLSDNTPNKIIPHKGDKLVFAAVTDIFPHGFAGEVQSVQTDANGNYNLDCELVTLTDIFEQYYSSSTKKEAVSRYYDYGTIPWKPGTIPIDLELDGIFPIKKLPDVELKAHYHGSFTPDFQIYIEQIISRRDFYSTKVTVVGEYDLENSFEVAGEISNGGDHKFGLWQPNAGIPFISKFFLEAGWIGGGNCKGSLTLNTFARRTFAFSRHWVTIAPQVEGTSNIKQTPPSGRELYGDYSLSGSLEGGFNVGLYLEAGFAFLDKRILSVGVRGEIGCEISGQISISQSDPQMESTEFYDNLKENYIKGELYAKGAFGLDYFKFGKDHEDKKNPHIKWTWMETPPLSYELFNFSLVPSFSKPVVTKNSQYPKYTDIASEVSNISLPASIGYAIKNSKGEIVESSYVAEGWNWGGGVMDKFNLQYTSEALKKGRDYTIYPLVKWNFWPYCEMIASPSSDFSDPLIIITSTSSQILASSARIHGIIDDYDSSSDIELGFYYGESPVINLNYGTYVSSTSENNGVFVCDLKNLKPETQYYYRACAIFDGEVIFADETYSFTTKERNECDIDFSIAYPAHYDYDCSWHPRPNDVISFSVAINPDIPETEDSTIISYGPIIYKDNKEVGGYILKRKDQYLIDGWVSGGMKFRRDELEINNIEYRAVVPESYTVGVQFEKITNNGDTIVLVSKEHKQLNWVYDEKPWICIYRCYGQGWDNYQGGYCDDRNKQITPGCQYHDPYSPDRFEFSGMVDFQTQGGFWMKSIKGIDSQSDVLDGFIYCYPIDNYSMGHSIAAYYSLYNIPQGVTAEWVDVNGKSVRANIVSFEYNSVGTVLPINFEDYTPLKRKNGWENLWPSIYNNVKSIQQVPNTIEDKKILAHPNGNNYIVKPMDTVTNISTISSDNFDLNQ